jgi:hypothetical protein
MALSFVDLILKPLAAALVMAWGASLFYRLFTGLLEGFFSLRLALRYTATRVAGYLFATAVSIKD